MTSLVKFSAPLALSCLLALTGCGDDDGGGDPDPADAAVQVTPDATVQVTPDAMTVASGAVGQLCSQTIACPAEAPNCVALAAMATEGICTADCGRTATNMTAPVGGDAVCAAIGSEDGTPVCALVGAAAADGMFDWSCGVACGMAGGMDLGGCPTGTTCQANNFCTP